jgi:hypothetical protein
MQVVQLQPPQHHLYQQYQHPPQHHLYQQYQQQQQQQPNKTQTLVPIPIPFKHLDTVQVPSRPSHTQPNTTSQDDADLVAKMKCMCMSKSEGVGNGGNHRKRAREPLPKVEKPRKRKRPLTRNLVENDEQYELYLAKLRKKQPITGNKYIFLKRIYRRYKFYKAGFEKWKELLQ